MPLISVVVPIYNVERYLTDCLESLAQQTHADLEVVMVDDGSTDTSPTIARSFADRDPRFRLVQQPNGGLGAARNTGADHATGDYIAFVDSDDVVVRNAYEQMVTSLEETGSDFATGNYHRLTVTGTWQAAMVATVFRANRARTHVSKHPALLNDRTAWNKLFRRSFWTEHGFRWPEGVLYEDIPVTLPAHVLATSVDVLRQPIYLWRARVGDSTSITQRRTEPRAIRDRTAAVDGVSRFLAEHGQDSLKEQYDRSVAEQDLRYFLYQLDTASEDFRALFLDLTNDYFDRAADDVFDPLPAIHRLQWHLARRRLMPELLEVLRFEKSGEINSTPWVRKGRRFYGDYPFRGDPALAIPDAIYRIERDELPLRARVEDVTWQGERLVLSGYAYIPFLDLSRARSSRIRVTLEESGHPESVVAMEVRPQRRADVTESAADADTCYDWSGFEASVEVSALRHRGRFRDGHWRLRVEVRSHGITRRRWVAATEPGPAKRPDLLVVDDARVIPTSEVGDFAVEVSTRSAEVTQVRVDGDVMELHGLLHRRALDPATARLRVARLDGTATIDLPAATAGAQSAQGRPFTARVPLLDLLTRREVGDTVAGTEDQAHGIEWELSLLPDDTGRRVRLVAAPGLPQPRLTLDGVEVALRSTRTGRLELVERHFRPEVEQIRWDDDGWLELAGRYHEPTGVASELLLREATVAQVHTAPVDREGTRFVARLRPQAMTTVAGAVPLAEGEWHLFLRAGDAPPVRVLIDRALLAGLPSARDVGARRFTVLDVEHDSLAIRSGSELPAAEVGRAARRRLETALFPAYLRLPRAEQLLVDAHGPGAYAEDARAIHEELARRRPDLRVLWSVVDGQAVLPEEVVPVVRNSSQWYEALARSRYVVASDYRGVPGLSSPDGQRVLQTWHGVPVVPVGLDDRGAASRLGRGWERRVRREAAQWDVLLSAGPGSTEVLGRAFAGARSLVETGLPRHDLLVDPDRAEVARRVRDHLGVPDGAHVVLYAPSYQVDQPDRRSQRYGWERYRFEPALDLTEAARGLGEDRVLLVRAHPKSVDALPEADGRRLVDVSRWPDSRELLLAADLLVTDHSSLLVDMALLGRPSVLWAPEAERRDWYVDPDTVPGAVVDTAAGPEGLLAAVRSLLDGRGPEEAALRGFVDRWCPLADGKAAARAVDALLET